MSNTSASSDPDFVGLCWLWSSTQFSSVLLSFLVGPVCWIFLLAVLVVIWRWKPEKNIPTSLPGPPRYPLLGMLWHPFQHWKQWPTECMRLSRLWNHATWGGPSFRYGALFYTDDPTNVRYVLSRNSGNNFDNYVKSDLWRSIFGELLGNGIFASDGHTWEVHRKISSRMFSRNLIKDSCQTVQRNCDIIIRDFCRRLLQEKNDSFDIDLQDLFLRLTLDSTAETVFGLEMKSLESGRQPAFTTAFEEIQNLLLERLVDPSFPIQRFLQCSARERRIKHLKNVLDSFCYDIIQQKRQEEEQKKKNETKNLDTTVSHTKENLLSLFLKYSLVQQHEKDDGAVSSADQELRDVILNFMVAGRDTTAVALSWTFYELSRHPAVVDKIIAEVEKHHCSDDDDDDDDEFSLDTIGKLSYTHAVAMEAIRLHPPVPMNSKFAIHDDTLPDGTHIPAGSMMNYLPLSMGRSETIWGADAHEFKPERFLEDENNKNKIREPSSFDYTMFNAGPRMCLGKTMSLTTIKTVLAKLLPKFHFTDKLRHSGEMEWLMVQKMKGGFVVSVTKRDNGSHITERE